jgi:hypothetical protein
VAPIESRVTVATGGGSSSAASTVCDRSGAVVLEAHDPKRQYGKVSPTDEGWTALDQPFAIGSFWPSSTAHRTDAIDC